MRHDHSEDLIFAASVNQYESALDKYQRGGNRRGFHAAELRFRRSAVEHALIAYWPDFVAQVRAALSPVDVLSIEQFKAERLELFATSSSAVADRLRLLRYGPSELDALDSFVRTVSEHRGEVIDSSAHLPRRLKDLRRDSARHATNAGLAAAQLALWAINDASIRRVVRSGMPAPRR